MDNCRYMDWDHIAVPWALTHTLHHHEAFVFPTSWRNVVAGFGES